VSRIQEQRREDFARYKKDVKEEGKPFFPYAMFHDTVMSLVVVCVIIILAVIWKFTAHETPGAAGWLGPLYAAPADPGTVTFNPRPDWYFYFLFYLLRIFKNPQTVILGTIGIPTVAIILLFALPFLDRRRERRILRRPVAIVAIALTVATMGILTYKGATVAELAGGAAPQLVASWTVKNNLPKTPLVQKGATIFASAGCLNCHTYAGSGSSNLGAPDLTAIGKTNNAVFFAQYVSNPRKFGNNVMPVFGAANGGSLSAAQLAQVGAFLAASKGGG
jgi:ubiquinol-cytochrome c reductase cytochrome b subunit/menaquinol-cytochrome c reductase cytochrome b/c subunit